ncbi:MULTISPECIES: DUF4359 domain-containing protein [unclassified Synechococcus]|uniref:DUF4359 domain-containing protein n=1 Tax=unclassified Synechococcus TaxID=2626047 RepID=UPI0012EA49BC|nr:MULTISPECIES: DUF4359 domain-containing protein [unclassified Synechococcus]MCP9825844.1 DUF4359 domain-containing protein [Synechococcus sp. EJ6-Ellesmere]WFN60202.1 DUF4359 domain-containing protein [Synechococcus sp. CCFWC 502]
MRPASSLRLARWCSALAVGGGVTGVALAFTNPGPEEFESFAGDQLAELAVEEVCAHRLPMPLKLAIQNCPDLVRSQHKVLGDLARRNTRRQNFGLFSLYRTEIGGPSVLPFLELPLYRVLTVAAAGHFRILRTSSDNDPDSATADRAPW